MSGKVELVNLSPENRKAYIHCRDHLFPLLVDLKGRARKRLAEKKARRPGDHDGR